MKNITIPQNSIVMTIGPSNSGKTYFCKLLVDYLTKSNVIHKYISSDAERRDLLCNDLHKHDEKMFTASNAAFQILNAKLDAYSSYPINIPIIILDATNMSKISRAEIAEYAKKNNYNLVGLVFDYKDKGDYFKYSKTDKNLDIRGVNAMIKKMRVEIPKEINKSDFHSLNYINSIDFSEISFSVEEISKNGRFINEENVCIVGDIHGCYEEFIECILDNKGIVLDYSAYDKIPRMMHKTLERIYDDNGNIISVLTPGYIHHILVGDLVDKGPDVEKIINFVHANCQWFTIIKGNHEEHNYNFLTKKIESSEKELELINNYFYSVKLFESNENLKSKFIWLYENVMFNFAYNDRFIVTHAPCKNKYLLKTNKKSLKKMMTNIYPKFKDYENEEKYLLAIEEHFQFLIEDSNINYPYHIFGHVPLKEAFIHNNKIGIDLGCVSGGMLGTVILNGNSRPYIKKYKSKQPSNKKLYNLFRTKQNVINFESLDTDVKKRIKFCAKNKVTIVSGTMSPVNKNIETNSIEDIAMGIKYYLDKNITSLIIEPKWMGSRAQFYCLNPIKFGYGILEKDNRNKIMSRNGFEIDSKRLGLSKEDFNLFIISVQKEQKNLFKALDADMIIFDGELLPWNIMAKDLIEKDFNLIYKAATLENKVLQETGFEQILETYKKSQNVSKSFLEFEEEIISIENSQKSLEKYKRQINIFNADSNLQFKAFAILKVIKSDGTEDNWVSSNHTNLAMFDTINNSPYCFINMSENPSERKAIIKKINVNSEMKCIEYNNDTITSEDFSNCIQLFWNYITEHQFMEGVVIKPNIAYIPGVAPYLKCRNTEYLRLTYGFDYDTIPVKTKRLIDNKSTNNKLKTSIKEYELSRELLDIPYKDISIENQKWLSIIVKLINEQDSEQDLDPRL